MRNSIMRLTPEICGVALASVLALAVQSPTLGAQSAWKSFGSSSEGFSALFPSQPEVNTSTVPVGGDTFELRSYVSEIGSTAFYVGICDYGPKGAAADPESLLTTAEKGAIEHVNAHLITAEKIAVKADQGVETRAIAFESENDQLHFSVRMYVAAGVLYQTMVAAPIKQPFADTARFLDSFQIVPHESVQDVAATTTGAAWKDYKYPADRFTASFPAEPRIEKQTISTDAGQFELRTYVAEDSSTALIAAVCNYGATATGKDPEALLDSAKAGAVQNLKARLLSEKKVTLGTNHGVAFEAENDSEHISAHIYIAGSILYQTLVVSPLKSRYADTARFLDSFELLEPEAK